MLKTEIKRLSSQACLAIFASLIATITALSVDFTTSTNIATGSIYIIAVIAAAFSFSSRILIVMAILSILLIWVGGAISPGETAIEVTVLNRLISSVVVLVMAALIWHLMSANRRLLLAQSELKGLHQKKLAFFASMGHNIRTPLNALIGFSEILSNSNKDNLSLIGDKERSEYALYILNASRNLLSFANELMLIAATDVTITNLRKELVDASNLVYEIVGTLRPVAEERGVIVHLESQDAAKPISADRVLLKQLLFNLIYNAIRFNKEQGTVKISVQADDKATRLVVEDTGRGIADEQIPTLFEAFKSGNSVDYIRDEGVGLGLHLVKQIIDAHHASISVSSALEKGTRFVIMWPALEDA